MEETLEITNEQKQTIYEALKRTAVYHNKKINEIKAIPAGLSSDKDRIELEAHVSEYCKILDLIGQIDDCLV